MSLVEARMVVNFVARQRLSGMQATASTSPFNLTRDPAASVPAGWTESGLPTGPRVVGPH